MNVALIQALPAIIAAADFGRLRDTGELTFESTELRAAAVSVGYTKPINKQELGAALRAVGAQNAPHGHHGAKYYIPGIISRMDAMCSITSNVAAITMRSKEH